MAAHGPVGVTGGQPVAKDLTLASPGAVARGLVLDASGGPVPGARVLAYVPGGDDTGLQVMFQARGDASPGGYQLELQPKTTVLQGHAPGYAAEVQSWISKVWPSWSRI